MMRGTVSSRSGRGWLKDKRSLAGLRIEAVPGLEGAR